MARKLRKKEGREIYVKRKTIVEPLFGQTKEVRGLRRFLLRGQAKVNGELMLWGTTHNLNKLWRHLKKQGLQAMATGKGGKPQRLSRSKRTTFEIRRKTAKKKMPSCRWMA
jgi:hypothetical protein